LPLLYIFAARSPRRTGPGNDINAGSLSSEGANVEPCQPGHQAGWNAGGETRVREWRRLQTDRRIWAQWLVGSARSFRRLGEFGTTDHTGSEAGLHLPLHRMLALTGSAFSMALVKVVAMSRVIGTVPVLACRLRRTSFRARRPRHQHAPLRAEWELRRQWQLPARPLRNLADVSSLTVLNALPNGLCSLGCAMGRTRPFRLR